MLINLAGDTKIKQIPLETASAKVKNTKNDAQLIQQRNALINCYNTRTISCEYVVYPCTHHICCMLIRGYGALKLINGNGKLQYSY